MKSAGEIIMQPIHDPVFEKQNIQVQILRLDNIHPGVSGNKWYKLKYNLEEALQAKYDTILTFGGAYSNHIHATAAAASQVGIKSIGVIRGERVEPLNPTLQDAKDCGMKLHFVSRPNYRNKNDEGFIKDLKSLFGDFYLIPEGGTNKLAIKGASEILEEIGEDFEYIMTPVGTGGTISGLISGFKKGIQVLGIPVLKGDFFKQQIEDLVLDYSGEHASNWELLSNYHFGGYAKFTTDLISFINKFKVEQNISLDPIYTGKMMYALYDLARKGYFRQGSKIIAIHTGGLQGIRGFNERFGDLIH